VTGVKGVTGVTEMMMTLQALSTSWIQTVNLMKSLWRFHVLTK